MASKPDNTFNDLIKVRHSYKIENIAHDSDASPK